MMLICINPNLGGLFRGLFWGEGKFGKEIWENLVLSENISFSTKARLILLMPAFFYKESAVFGKYSTFTQGNSVRAVLEIFYFCFQFL